MAQLNITLETELLHGLFSKDKRDDAFAKLLEEILNQVLSAQLFLLSRPVSKQLLDIVREQVLLISCFAADSPIKYQ